MATLRTMRFALGRTVNLGNFNSTRVDYEEVVELDATDDHNAVYASIRERVYSRLYGECQAIVDSENRKTNR